MPDRRFLHTVKMALFVGLPALLLAGLYAAYSDGPDSRVVKADAPCGGLRVEIPGGDCAFVELAIANELARRERNRLKVEKLRSQNQ